MERRFPKTFYPSLELRTVFGESMSLSRSPSRYTASWSVRGVSGRDNSHVQDRWNFLWFVKVKHDTFFLRQMETRKKSEPQMGFETTTLRILVRCFNHWATGDSMACKGESGSLTRTASRSHIVKPGQARMTWITASGSQSYIVDATIQPPSESFFCRSRIWYDMFFSGALVRSGAPLVRKFGNLCIQEILVLGRKNNICYWKTMQVILNQLLQ